VLKDPLWNTAAMSINDDYGGKSKHEIGMEVHRKQQAIEQLLKKYTSGIFTLLLFPYISLNNHSSHQLLLFSLILPEFMLPFL
jgi:hypothetical protein